MLLACTKTVSKNNETNLELSYLFIDAMSRDIDWGQALDENGEGWTSFEAVECEDCGLVHVLGAHGQTTCADEMPEFEDENGDEVDNICQGCLNPEGPMMSFYWPCAVGDFIDESKGLQGLPVCIVDIRLPSGTYETGIALTGGGMDLSWELCETYIRLGYYPPFSLASNLPDMADKHNSPSAQLVLAAAAETCRAVKERAGSAMERNLDRAKEYAAKVAAGVID